jgi:hypothetical protein
MEDSYRQSLILEPGNCQEGKYEEKGKEKEHNLGEGVSIYTRLFELIKCAKNYPTNSVCTGHMTRLASPST